MVSDSQSTRGVQGQRMKRFWRVVVVLVCAVVGFFCVFVLCVVA